MFNNRVFYKTVDSTNDLLLKLEGFKSRGFKLVEELGPIISNLFKFGGRDKWSTQFFKRCAHAKFGSEIT